MLTLTSSNERNSNFMFIFTGKNNHHSVSLISDNSSLMFLSNNGNGDTCSFISEPSDASIMAFGESNGNNYGETNGSIAYTGGETCGSIASSSISSFSGSSSSSFTCCC